MTYLIARCTPICFSYSHLHTSRD